MRFAVRWTLFILACVAVMWGATLLVPPAHGQEEQRCYPEIMMVAIVKSQIPVDVTDEISGDSASRAVLFIDAHTPPNHPALTVDTILVLTGEDFPAVVLLGFLGGCYRWRLIILTPAYDELRRAAEGPPA